MSRKRWLPIVVLLSLSVLAGLPRFVSPRAQAKPLAQTTPTYFNYSVKFVCGVSRGSAQFGEQGEPPVKPGNYATEINIHNYTYRDVGIRKKVLILVGPPEGAPTAPPRILGREPNSVKPREQLDTIILGPDGATMDDCNRIWQIIHPDVPLPPVYPLTIGYLVLISRVDLDVDAVYTSQALSSLQAGAAPVFNGMAMEVERIPGKRVSIPDSLFPGPIIP